MWKFIVVLFVVIGESCIVASFSSTNQNLHVSTRPSLTRLAGRRFRTGNRDSYENSYLATCIPGLAPVLATELEALGMHDVQPSGKAGVTFTGSTRDGLKCLLWLRTAHKLLQQVTPDESSSWELQSRDDLYDFVRDHVNIKRLLGDGSGGLLTLNVKVVLNHQDLIPEDINHSHYSALTIKNALVDAVRDLRGDRPDVDKEASADVPLVCFLRGQELPDRSTCARATLYKSLHPPGSLHRRGYRAGMAIHRAAMKESMAAGLLMEAGWPQRFAQDSSSNPLTILVDPMAGSGSLVLEAAMMSRDIAPGLMRIKCGLEGHRFPPVLRWRTWDDDYNDRHWRELLQEATERAKAGATRSLPPILANDVHAGAMEMCRASLREAGLADTVQTRIGDCVDLKLPSYSTDARVLVATNPPWWIRLDDDMHDSWEALRHFLRHSGACPDDRTEAWVLSGNKHLTKHLGLKKSHSLCIQTAQQDLRWIQYKIGKPPAAEGSASSGGAEQYTSQSKPSEAFPVRPTDEGSDVRSTRNVPQSRGSRDGRFDDRRMGRSGRNNPDRRKKHQPAPMTEQEREERKNSWYI